MTPGEEAALSRLLNRFEKAAKEHAFKGAKHPGEHEFLDEELAHSRKLLRRFCRAKRDRNTARSV